MAERFELIRPDDAVPYSFDLANVLGSGETISTHAWSISPTGPTLGSPTAATVIVSGCAVGKTYRLEYQATTNASPARTYTRTLTLRCEDT